MPRVLNQGMAPFTATGVEAAGSLADDRFILTGKNDRAVVSFTVAGGGCTLRPVYIFDDATTQHDQPDQDITAAGAGSIVREFPIIPGARLALRTQAIAGTSVSGKLRTVMVQGG